MSGKIQRRERRRGFDRSGLPRTWLRDGGYVAELIQDRRGGNSRLVHCVIQREGSPEILFYTQFASLDAAKDWAMHELSNYASRQDAA